MKDLRLLPSRGDVRKISRYEAHLERQFERKLRQLVAWRRAKGEAAFENSGELEGRVLQS
jgi:hypothetical protein